MDGIESSTGAAQPVEQQEQATYLHVESRPARLIAAHYTHLPFPMIGPMQEVAFDLGITAVNGDVTLNGMVIQGYNDHQLLFEQRWPARLIRQRLGEENLAIPAGTGLALHSLHFMIHGYEPLTMIQVTIVGKTGPSNQVGDQAGDQASEQAGGQTTQAVLQIPVEYHENKTDLHFPLRGAWWAIQAADWSDRHKQEVFSQTYALDFVKLGADNAFFQGNGLTVEDHYSWNQPVYATAGGKVAYVCADMPDLQPGVPPNPRMFREDPRRLLGNAVAISHANGEFSFYGCLQQGNVVVNEGDMIRRGALIGYVGNSGNSPGPHLHFHLMEGPNPFIDQGLPVKFSHFAAGGQYFEQPMTIPTRMIVMGPVLAEGEE